MRYIFCRKCGTKIDADLGVCPVCGAVYYVLDDVTGESAAEPVNVSEDGAVDDSIRVFKPVTPLAQETVPETVREGQSAARQQGVRPDRVRPMDDQPPQNSAVRPDRVRQTPPPQPPRKKKKKRSGLSKGFLLGALVLLTLLTVVMSFMAGAFDFSGESRGDKMPDVEGMALEDAIAELDALDIRYSVARVDSEEPAGQVIAQSVDPRTVMNGSETVILTVSNGPQSENADGEKVPVPDLRNMNFEAARQLLSEKGLNISRSEDVYSDTVPEGCVVTQSPENGEVEKGSTIHVTVSKGEEPAPTFTITVTAGKGGTVTPRGQVEVEEGQSASFTIIPDAGYEVREVKVDGQDVGAVTEYTFSDVRDDHTIYVVFQVKPAETEPPVETAPPATEAPVIETPVPEQGEQTA